VRFRHEPPIGTTLKRAAAAFIEHDAFTLAAALAFYVTLAFAPTVVLALWLAASVGRDAQDRLLNELDLLGGPDARAAAQLLIDNAHDKPATGTLAGVLGIAFLIISASAVFAQLQASLNILWRIAPRRSGFALQWVRHRLLSIGMLAASIFILIVTLVVSAALSWILGRIAIVWDIVNQLIAFGVFTTLFSALFRYLPDRRIPLAQALRGGLITSALFTAGKFLIGEYLAHSNAGGSYGPAGAFVMLLLWVYYSAAVFYFGAELVGQQPGFDEFASAAPRIDEAARIRAEREPDRRPWPLLQTSSRSPTEADARSSPQRWRRRTGARSDDRS
jgi:membrane protein